MPNAINRRAVLATLAAASVASPARAADSRPSLTLGVQSSPQSLEPLREFSNVSWRIGYKVFEG